VVPFVTVVLGSLAFAQITPASFEVASVKPNTSGSGSSSLNTLPGGRFQATNATVRQLILAAYRLKRLQLTGGPSWIDSEHFDVEARAAENVPPEQTMTMLKGLLGDRFKLVTHNETKDQPVYALVLARNDRSLGPQLKPTTLDCSDRQSSPTAGRAPVRRPPMVRASAAE
jgi:uncharacterized protein (TIGR03435 family)